MSKYTRLELIKYDINQKLLKELSDLESRTILFSIVSSSKLPIEISYDNKIPLSSVYKKLRILESLGLISVEKIELVNRAKSKYFRSTISEAKIRIVKFEPTLHLISNKT